jgi:hypothetical protein
LSKHDAHQSSVHLSGVRGWRSPEGKQCRASFRAKQAIKINSLYRKLTSIQQKLFVQRTSA